MITSMLDARLYSTHISSGSYTWSMSCSVQSPNAEDSLKTIVLIMLQTSFSWSILQCCGIWQPFLLTYNLTGPPSPFCIHCSSEGLFHSKTKPMAQKKLFFSLKIWFCCLDKIYRMQFRSGKYSCLDLHFRGWNFFSKGCGLWRT